jgi:hypothetical protein
MQISRQSYEPVSTVYTEDVTSPGTPVSKWDLQERKQDDTTAHKVQEPENIDGKDDAVLFNSHNESVIEANLESSKAGPASEADGQDHQVHKSHKGLHAALPFKSNNQDATANNFSQNEDLEAGPEKFIPEERKHGNVSLARYSHPPPSQVTDSLPLTGTLQTHSPNLRLVHPLPNRLHHGNAPDQTPQRLFQRHPSHLHCLVSWTPHLRTLYLVGD